MGAGIFVRREARARGYFAPCAVRAGLGDFRAGLQVRGKVMNRLWVCVVFWTLAGFLLFRLDSVLCVGFNEDRRRDRER